MICITSTFRYEPELAQMIERYRDDKAILAHTFGEKIKTSAYNERSFQCQQIKMCWLSKTNPEHRMAENVLEKELDNDPETSPRKIHCVL